MMMIMVSGGRVINTQFDVLSYRLSTLCKIEMKHRSCYGISVPVRFTAVQQSDLDTVWNFKRDTKVVFQVQILYNRMH